MIGTGMTMTWEGADGSSWSLLDPMSPVRAVSVAGLGLPGYTQQFAETAAVDGRRYEGTTWAQNTVTLQVTVGDDYLAPGFTRRRRDDDWRRLDATFRRSLSPERAGRLVVITAAGGTRYLRLRLDQPVSPPAGQDPAWLGEATYSVQLTADDEPWWTGPEVSAVFTYVDQSQPFFGGTSGSVLLYISPASALTTAAIGNPGHRPAPPRWWARGGFGALRVGVADRLVPLPFPLTANQMVYVDSAAQTITDGQGGDLWPLMGFTDPDFAEIPPGELVPLRIEMDGAVNGAQVGISLTPRYDGPW